MLILQCNAMEVVFAYSVGVIDEMTYSLISDAIKLVNCKGETVTKVAAVLVRKLVSGGV